MLQQKICVTAYFVLLKPGLDHSKREIIGLKYLCVFGGLWNVPQPLDSMNATGYRSMLLDDHVSSHESKDHPVLLITSSPPADESLLTP